MNNKPSRLPTFTMEFEPATIEHLGLKLYVSLPPVIGELVSNAWDADAERVDITFPEGPITPTAEVVVRDYGVGMDEEEIQNAYLRIGRNRRDETGSSTSPGKGRAVMGRKGIGKLSAFGIASEIEVRAIKGGKAVCLRLNYDQMRACTKGQPYQPEVVADRCGPTEEPDGTEVRIRRLHRKRPIDKELLKKQLARRFTVVGDDFKVFLNGDEITPTDRRLRGDCRKAWDVKELPKGDVVDTDAGWKVTGWVGIVEKSSQTERGVDVFAHGKAVELETMFGVRTTHNQWARAYLVGEIHADFLDAEEDNISTARNSAHWESEAGQKLQEWGVGAITFVADQWLLLQRAEKEARIRRTADFDKWLQTRSAREQKVANKLIRAIVEDANIEPESAGPLLDVIKTNVEFQAFQELVEEIESSGPTVPTVLKLFEDWRVIEAREHLRLSDGRLEVMEKLAKYIDEGALEVKQIQPLFEENGWLINPTWGHVSGQNTYTKLLRKHCEEPKDLPEEDKRMDILGYEVGGTLWVVELKRPKKTLTRDNLEQIEGYVDWARAHLVGTGPDSPKYVCGLLLVGKMSKEAAIQSKVARLAGSDIRVETFDDLLHRARKIYGEVERRLKAIAPEYSRAARKAGKKSSS
jgi:hypothetical protein